MASKFAFLSKHDLKDLLWVLLSQRLIMDC